MEADWDEIQRLTVPPPSLDALLATSPASTVAFDTSQELLWVGNEYGRLTSFYGPELRRYTSIVAHPEDKGPVKQMLFCDKGVLSVAPTSISLSARRGLPLWTLDSEVFSKERSNDAARANEKDVSSKTVIEGIESPEENQLKDLRCVAYMGKDQRHAIAAGHQHLMLQLDVRTGEVVTRHPAHAYYAMMRRSTAYICAATDSGQIDLLDPDTLRVVKTLATSNVRLNDMDARSNYLVTCGWVNRPQGGPMLSTLANVYDLRQLVQLPPIPFQPGAAHVQMHPKLSTTCVIASQSGQIQVVDLMNQNMINLRQANLGGPMQVLTMAPTGEALAIADANGQLTLWGSPSRISFAEFSNPTDFQDIPASVTVRLGIRECHSPIDLDADLPLNCIGMPFYREPLLSQWPVDQVYDVGSPPAKIEPAITNDLRAGSIGYWAANPFERTRPRNLAEKSRTLEQDGAPLAAPKFLSERAKAKDFYAGQERRISDIQDLVDNISLKGVTKNDVPLMYRNVEIKYSKFGIEDFDFEYYNKTRFSGLETHIANSYTNPLLQLFKFTPLVRNLALHHTAANCLSEICLLCELGFLIDMLEKAEGQNCQATNFLKAFSSLPEAGRLHLLEEYSHISTLAEMMQSACRFILNQAMNDYRRVASNTRLFEQTFALNAVQHMRCNQCHNEMVKPGSTLTTDLSYTNTSGGRARNQVPTFSQCLKRSIEGDAQTRGWCDRCRRYQYLQNRRNMRSTPDVLIINTLAKGSESKRYWSTPGWLPDRIGISIDGGKFVCFEGEDLRLHLEKQMYNLKVYDLVGIVADIQSGEHQKSHLVSLINVGVSEGEDGGQSDWHLFNDFLVRQLKTEEALKFNPSWKMPAVLMFQSVDGRQSRDDSWKEKLDTALLFTDWSSNKILPENCQVLDKSTEAPRFGDYVAIDTEFVSLQQEEIEIKADGEREVVRPTRMGLARVSVLRGAGEEEGRPFINDYITVSEPIVDYLTIWSGVYEGDLDPRTSTHPLVPLKVSYKKLWLLVNLGCIFVGHGLPKDFRIINIHVPKAQVVDTVELFFLPDRHRRLSLRFLVWYLLKEDIQQENHDSIEDARSALRLWRKYQEFHDAGIVLPMLEEIYREGKKSLYKPPSEAQSLLMRKRAETASGSGGASQNEAVGTPGALAAALVVAATGSSGSDDLLGGRETPDLASGGVSLVSTPVGRRTGRGSEYFDSPLR